jgi:hypothetical protein
MFLRQTRREKDGKTHSYWSVFENQGVEGERRRPDQCERRSRRDTMRPGIA